ncbi:MAG: thiamine biosynthesis lipoprotein [Parcubacteria bacterium C7867-004]|nr:MAG: thiamine biosynthesis lipoprotein [Parcubacteria bacterium C7867-004]
MKEYDYEKKIMGSEASLSIIAPTPAIANAAVVELFEIAENEEARFSRFREESELSRLNRERSCQVSKEFMDAFLLGKELYRTTHGTFNPLVDISRFGYDADIAVVKGTNRIGKEIASYDTDMESVLVDQETMTISLAEGQNLDFGGYMKGHTAEKMAKAAKGCQGVLVNLGGDIYARGLDAEGKPFIFVIEDPTDAGIDLSFFATNAGIATSGSYNRHWNYLGTPFFHILDASGTKNPATEILSATVIARSGAEADAYATAALILGIKPAERFLEENGCEYCLIGKDGSLTFSGAFPLVQKAESYLYA